MITVRLKIGSGEGSPADTTTYGLVYISSDHILGPVHKDYEVTSYPEEEGEHILNKVVDAPFDYKVKFYVRAEGSLENANQKISAFNALLYTQDSGSDTKVMKRVSFYNDYKKVLIVGYPSPISEATDFWRDSAGKAHDVVVVEWKIRVDKPSECNFNLTASSSSSTPSST